MATLGIISGAYVLRETFFHEFEELKRDTRYGPAQVYLKDDIAFLARHGNPAEKFILPHLINHLANMALFKELGVREIFAFNSTGSLKRQFKPGMFAVPTDFILLAPSPSAMIHGNSHDHIVPELSVALRRQIVEAVRFSGLDEPIEDCIYWQTSGPRLETKAEIRLMASFADLVGMTMASEAVAAGEMGLAYASLCSIDNYASGISEEQLTVEVIADSASRQMGKIIKILEQLLKIKGAVE